MAEQQEVTLRKVQLKNTSTKGSRFVHDATGRQYLLGPGEEAEVEVAEGVATALEEQSKAGSDLRVSGFDPEPAEPNEAAVEEPEEHETRTALAEAERDVMEEGQEADKDRRERATKKTGEQLAAETGIH